MIIKKYPILYLQKYQHPYKINLSFKIIITSLFLYIVINYCFVIGFLKLQYNKLIELFFNIEIKKESLYLLNKTNIDFRDEFFQIIEVQEQIYDKNLTFINTLSGGGGNIGNALIILNNLINICEKIRCKYIISPFGLENIIKNPIFYKEYNIIIFPNEFKSKTKIDIELSIYNSFYFRYRKKSHEIRLSIIREEVLRNIPKYRADPSDLYINIRSGDVFVNVINENYAQPPLCFYQKIINENIFKNHYIVSNGHENPVVDKLLKLYPKIKFIHDSVEGDISIIVNAFNLVMPVSTFPLTLIRLNNNLKNLYIYEINPYNLKKVNCTIHKMEASLKYKNIMKGKWQNNKEQLELMLSENCTDTKITSFYQTK